MPLLCFGKGGAGVITCKRQFRQSFSFETFNFGCYFLESCLNSKFFELFDYLLAQARGINAQLASRLTFDLYLVHLVNIGHDDAKTPRPNLRVWGGQLID